VPPTRGEGRVLLGQAFVELGPDTFAALEVEAGLADKEMAIATFEAVLGTLEVAGVEELAAQRHAAAERSGEFQRHLAAGAVHKSLIEQQLFRIVETPPGRKTKGPEKDIGWTRVRQGTGERIARTGFRWRSRRGSLSPGSPSTRWPSISHRTMARTKTGRSDDATPHREARPTGKDDATMRTNTETGIRAGGKIDIRVEVQGSGPVVLSFPEPEATYLSQAHAWALPQLLPADEPATYGFYWYSSDRQKVVYRSDRVIPALDRFTLVTRLSPDDAETAGRVLQ